MNNTIDSVDNLPLSEFVTDYNTQFGTDYTVDDATWIIKNLKLIERKIDMSKFDKLFTIRETEMMDELLDVFSQLSPVEFVEEYNRQLGAFYTVNDVIWDYKKSQDKENQNE